MDGRARMVRSIQQSMRVEGQWVGAEVAPIFASSMATVCFRSRP